MGKLKHEDRLKGVDERLVRVLVEAVAGLPFDCTVAEGVRTPEQAFINFGKGRTVRELTLIGVPARYAKPDEAKVTWVSAPLATKHIGGKAADIYPLTPAGKLADTSKAGLAMYDALYHAVMLVAAQHKVRVRYGGDWDGDGRLREKGETDSPHFELS